MANNNNHKAIYFTFLKLKKKMCESPCGAPFVSIFKEHENLVILNE